MTLTEVIALADDIKPNTFSTTLKVKWISDVELEVAQRILKRYGKFKIDVVGGQASYDLPNGVNFGYITNMSCFGTPLTKIDERSNENVLGYFLNSDNKIEIFPVPNHSKEGGLVGTYLVTRDRYATGDVGETLLLDPPHDNVYLDYVLAKIDWHNNDYDEYHNTMNMYNSSFMDAAKFYQSLAPATPVKHKNIW